MVLADHAQKSFTIEERTLDVEEKSALLIVTAGDLLRCGILFLHSLTEKMEEYLSLYQTRTWIPEWVWKGWPVLCRMSVQILR